MTTIPSGVYTWTNPSEDLQRIGQTPAFIAENTGGFTVVIHGHRWTHGQDSSTAKLTYIQGTVSVDGRQVTFLTTGPAGEPDIGHTWTATWTFQDSMLNLSNFSNQAWGDVVGLHPWRRTS